MEAKQRTALGLGALLWLMAPGAAGGDIKKAEREKYSIQVYAGARLDWERREDKPSRLQIKKVEKGSEAERMGYRKGDEVVAIGGEGAGSKRWFEFARRAAEAESFRVLRKKEELELPPLFRTSSAMFSAEHPLGVGERAPAINVRLPEGTRDLLKETRGKVVLLNFWASWCKPCVEEMPVLARLQASFKRDDFRLYCVNVDDDAQAMRDFLDKNPMSLTVVTTGGMLSSTAMAYDATRIPLNVLVDREGRIAALSHGYSPTEQERLLAHAVEAVLEGKEPPLSITRK